jgi:hypothetical protein
MLYKKFGSDVYQRLQPEYKTYQTDNGKETLLISKNYSVLKQGKYTTLTVMVIKILEDIYICINTKLITVKYSW